MPRVLLLNDNVDQDNWGAQATPYAIKKMLRDAIPGVEIESMTYGRMTRRFHVPRFQFLGSRAYTIKSSDRLRIPKFLISRSVNYFPEIADDFEYFGDLWDAGQGGPIGEEFINQAGKTDIVIFNAENGIYRNAGTGMRGLFMTWYARTRLGVPAGVINQTARVSDMDRPIMRGIVKMLYPKLDVVTAREAWSYQDLQTAGLENVENVPDVVFYLGRDEWHKERQKLHDWKRSVGLSDDEPYFCLGASSLPMGRHRPDHGSPVAELVRSIQKREQRAVLMAKDAGCLFLRDVARETDSIYFGPEHTFHELWPLLEGAQFLVTGHFHYAIMAAQVGCPFVAMSTNNHKMEGVLEDLKWHSTRTYDSTALRYEHDEVLEAVDQVIQDREKLSQHLIEVSASLGERAARNATLVKGVLERTPSKLRVAPQ